MPSATTDVPVPGEAPAGPRAHRVLAVDVRDTPDVLSRILTILLGRCCTVTYVDFVARDRHYPGRLVLGYDAPAAHADRAADWLRALVDVLTVESLDGVRRP